MIRSRTALWGGEQCPFRKHQAGALGHRVGATHRGVAEPLPSPGSQAPFPSSGSQAPSRQHAKASKTKLTGCRQTSTTCSLNSGTLGLRKSQRLKPKLERNKSRSPRCKSSSPNALPPSGTSHPRLRHSFLAPRNCTPLTRTLRVRFSTASHSGWMLAETQRGSTSRLSQHLAPHSTPPWAPVPRRSPSSAAEREPTTRAKSPCQSPCTSHRLSKLL